MFNAEKFIKNTIPKLKEEIKGIADGINARGEKIFNRDVTYEDIVTLSEMQGCWYALKFFWRQFHPMKSLFYGIKNIFSHGDTENTEKKQKISLFV